MLLRPKMIAPMRLIRAAVPQAITGTGDPDSGIPVLSAATSSRAAMPRAVPSCAAVLMIPEAVPRKRLLEHVRITAAREVGLDRDAFPR